MSEKIIKYSELVYPFDEPTKENEQYNSGQYERREAFEEGFLLGAEFAEWASDQEWVYFPKDRNVDSYWMQRLTKRMATTPELTELFLTDKMKEK